MCQIKPDLILHLSRKWFAEIAAGRKCVEFREKKPYWDKRIGGWLVPGIRFVEFRLGYARAQYRMLAQVGKVDVGQCPYEGWDGDYYRLRFALVGLYWFDGETYWPYVLKTKGEMEL